MLTRISTLRFLFVCALATGSAVLTGCGKKTVDNDSQSPAAPHDSAVATADSAAPTTPPAAESDDTFDQTPTGLCRRFMESLQAEKAVLAENLLTRVAQMNTTAAELEMKAIGGPNAKFSIGDVRYATQQQNVAQVDCEVTDTDAAADIQMTWIVKRNKTSWRISGVMMQADDDLPLDLLSFENIEDVRRMKASGNQDELASHTKPVAHQANAILSENERK